MSLENDIQVLLSWSSNNLSVTSEGFTPLSGQNSLYESYLSFMSKQSSEALPLRQFCSDIFLLYALKYNVFLTKHRITRGVVIYGLELASEPISKIETNDSVMYKFK